MRTLHAATPAAATFITASLSPVRACGDISCRPDGWESVCRICERIYGALPLVKVSKGY